MGMSEKAAVDFLQDKAHRHLVEVIEKEVNPEYFAVDGPDDDAPEQTDVPTIDAPKKAPSRPGSKK